MNKVHRGTLGVVVVNGLAAPIVGRAGLEFSALRDDVQPNDKVLESLYGAVRYMLYTFPTSPLSNSQYWR